MNNKKNTILATSILIAFCAISLLPYFLMCLCCFSTSADIKGNIIFDNLSWQNFFYNVKTTLNGTPLIKSIANSFLVSTLASIIGIVVSSLAAYSYTFQKHKTGDLLFYITVYAMYIPEATLLIPTFLLFKNLGMLNTYFAVVMASMSVPFLLYLFRQNALLLPKEIIKSAKLDGASEISIFFRIFIPNLKEVVIAAFIISFLNAWNTILLPVVILQSQSKFTNAIYLNSLGSVWFGDYAVLMTSIVISTLPMVVMFLVFQRYIKKAADMY